jgi:GxxExxY protein
MDTDEHGFHLPSGELTHKIIGCAMAVLNELGHGLHEKPYEKALLIELRLQKLAAEPQRVFPILYKGNLVGEYVPDIIVENEVILDAKVVERITDHERG